MSKNVCLIIPPSPFLLDERVFPFLGPLKVAAVLEQAGWPVEVLDLSGYSNYCDAARAHARASKATHFGLTATTPQLPAAVEIAEVIRTVRPDAKLLLGGAHATLVVAARKYEISHGRSGRAQLAYERLEKHFDTIVSGDGEEAVFLACQEGAPKLVDADERKSPLFLDNARLNATPFPARHLIDMESYNYSIDGVPALSLIAQLGCPFQCGFCAGRRSPMLRNIRMRSTENIVEEMTQLYLAYGKGGFMFYDDELNVSRTMVELMGSIAERQKELGVEWRLRGFIKAELFTDEQAAIMYRAGFRWILVGFETGSPRILKNIEKKATREENTRCVEIARRHGLKVKALMSVGHPGESEVTIRETKEWLLSVRPDDFDATIITPYPGSPYYDEAVFWKEGVWKFSAKNGDTLYQKEVDYTMIADYYKGDPDDGYVSHVFTEALSAKDLVVERDALEREVRGALGIPFNPASAPAHYEHSMGQTVLPARMLRSSNSV